MAMGGDGGGSPLAPIFCLVMYLVMYCTYELLETLIYCVSFPKPSIPRPGMFYPPQNGVNGTLISWATTSMWHYKCFLFNLQQTNFSFPVPRIKERTRFYLSINFPFIRFRFREIFLFVFLRFDQFSIFVSINLQNCRSMMSFLYFSVSSNLRTR